VGIAIGGTAVGVLSIGAILGLVKYLKRGQKKQEQQNSEEQQEQQEEKKLADVVLPVQTDVAYLCVASSDLEDIQRILTIFKKRFVVLNTIPLILH
jgi:H+/gluconate symporter-like permease